MKSKKDRLQQLKRQVEYVKNLPITSETNRPIVNSSQLNESSFDFNKNEMSNIQSEHNEDFNRELEDSAFESKTLKDYSSTPHNHLQPFLHVKHPKILKDLESETQPSKADKIDFNGQANDFQNKQALKSTPDQELLENNQHLMSENKEIEELPKPREELFEQIIHQPLILNESTKETGPNDKSYEIQHFIMEKIIDHQTDQANRF